MGLLVEKIAIDCRDAYGLAVFWSGVTGYPVDPEDGPGSDETDVVVAVGPSLHFNEVPEPKREKNRVHLCLRPDTTCAREVERVRGLGATLVEDRRRSGGLGWVVLADPEGNEFCVLRGEAERGG